MVAYEHGDVVGRGMPAWLPRHLVVNCSTVYLQSLEGDVFHFAALIVAVNDGDVWRRAIIANVAEQYILHPCTWCCAIFLVPSDLHLSDATVPYLLDADVVEGDVFHVVVVAAVDGEASLIVNLRFSLADDVDVFVAKIDHAVSHSRIAMQTDEDGMSHVGPKS